MEVDTIIPVNMPANWPKRWDLKYLLLVLLNDNASLVYYYIYYIGPGSYEIFSDFNGFSKRILTIPNKRNKKLASLKNTKSYGFSSANDIKSKKTNEETISNK